MALYRERDLKQFTKEVTHDGIGIGGGFVVGGLVGSLVESKLAPQVTFGGEYASTLQKLWGWAVNNGSKAAMYVLAKKYDSSHPMAKKASEALAGSVVYDTIIRLANGGNPLTPGVFLGGYRILGANGKGSVNKLVQENSILRTELNKALQRLAGPNTYPPSPNLPGRGVRPPGMNPNQGLAAVPPLPHNPPTGPDSAHDFKYGGVPSPAVQARQREFGAMPWTPDVMERERRYGAMPFEQSQDVLNRQKRYGSASPTVGGLPYGAMPFEQNTEKTARQRHFGQMQEPVHGVMYETYGMR